MNLKLRIIRHRFSLGLLCGLCPVLLHAQQSIYYKAIEAINTLEDYKKFTAANKGVKNLWKLSTLETIQFTPTADGGGTFSWWNGGLSVDYDFDKYDFAAVVHPDARPRPTGRTTFVVNNQSITIKTYNDVQYAEEFNERTGAPKRPNDPYREFMGCNGRARTVDFEFLVGTTPYKCKAYVTCSHTYKLIPISFTGKHYDSSKRKVITIGGYNGDDGNFISPWKFMHTQTINVKTADMAKAMGLNQSEFFYSMLKDGLQAISCEHFGSIITSNYGYVITMDNMQKLIRQQIWPLANILAVMGLHKSGKTLAQLEAEKPTPQQIAQQRVDMLLSMTIGQDNVKQASEYMNLVADDYAKGVYMDYEVFSKLIQQKFTDIVSVLGKSNLYEAENKCQQMIECYIPTVSSSSDDIAARLYNYLSIFQLARGEKNEAYESALTAISYRPNHIPTLETLGRAALAIGNKKEAVNIWKKQILKIDKEYAQKNTPFYQMLKQGKLVK